MDRTSYTNLAKSWEYVEDHAFSRQSTDLNAIRTHAEEAGIPQGSAAQAELLRMLVHMVNATSVIAVGTGSVVETLQLVNGLDNSGQLTAVDSSSQGLRVRDMFPAACACGIGFTVSFLISSLAYQDAELSAEARFGVLVGSIVAAVISGILLSRQSKKFELAAAASSKHKHHTADEDAAGEVESVLEDGTVVVSQMIDTHPKVK